MIYKPFSLFSDVASTFKAFSSWFLIIMLITSEHTLDMFQLISQRQAKHADYSTALRDGNAERNRARALMPGEQGCFTNSMQLLQKAM